MKRLKIIVVRNGDTSNLEHMRTIHNILGKHSKRSVMLVFRNRDTDSDIDDDDNDDDACDDGFRQLRAHPSVRHITRTHPIITNVPGAEGMEFVHCPDCGELIPVHNMSSREMQEGITEGIMVQGGGDESLPVASEVKSLGERRQ